MNRYETGIRTPDHLTTTNIARALDLPLPFFYAETNEMAKHILSFGNSNLEQYVKLIQLLDE